MNIIVPVSGGKDSQVVLALAIENYSKKDIVCIHQNTGFDHPDTYQQLIDMSAFYGVEIKHTVSKYKDMFGFLEKAKYFPNSAARGCTQRLKQEPFAKWLKDCGFNKDNSLILFGMRSDESSARNTKYGSINQEDTFSLGNISAFYSNKNNSVIGDICCKLPIVTWTTENVFDFLIASGAPINPLYIKGHHRVGCYPCLLARKSEWELAGADPIGKLHIERLIALEDMWKKEKNPRKFIKVHRNWDVRKFINGNPDDVVEDVDHECGYCSI